MIPSPKSRYMAENPVVIFSADNAVARPEKIAELKALLKIREQGHSAPRLVM